MSETPVCEECDREMNRYWSAPDTGRNGWRCDRCGWTDDDDPEPVQTEEDERMSKDPGQLAYDAFWNNDGSWEQEELDARAVFARVEAAVRADEREKCRAEKEELNEPTSAAPDAIATSIADNLAIELADMEARRALREPRAAPDAQYAERAWQHYRAGPHNRERFFDAIKALLAANKDLQLHRDVLEADYDAEKARAEVVEKALQSAHRVFQFDLRKMITWGDDYNQAVKDAADKVAASLAQQEK
jgi:hypothetical protein